MECKIHPVATEADIPHEKEKSSPAKGKASVTAIETHPHTVSHGFSETPPGSPVKRRSGRSSANSAKVQVINLLKSKYYTSFMTVALLMALFFPDIWVLVDSIENAHLDWLLSLVMVLFVAEIGLNTFAWGETYVMSFWFCADFVGTFSILFDLGFVWGQGDEPIREGDSKWVKNAVVLRAARAAKLGARAGRFPKLLKYLSFIPGVMLQEEGIQTAQVMSKKLQKTLSTRVALLSILLVVVLPLFELETYPAEDRGIIMWTETFAEFSREGRPLADEVARCAGFYADKELDFFPFRIAVANETWSLREAPNRVSNELHANANDVKVFFDFTSANQYQSIMNIVLILVLVILMIGFSLILSNNVSGIILQPLERILKKVKAVTANIFQSATIFEDEDDKDVMQRENPTGANETEILEHAIQKLAAMSELMMKKRVVDAEDMKNMAQDDVAILEAYGQGNTEKEKNANADMLDDRSSKHVGGAENLDPSSSIPGPDEEYEVLVDTWEFDVLNVDRPKLTQALMWVYFRSEQANATFATHCDPGRMHTFLGAAELAYLNNAYHNWQHGVDVCHTVYRCLCLTGAHLALGNNDRFGLLVGAVCHDVGHPGLNNPFLKETGHELALRYNDASPLENMHCSKLFNIATRDEADIFRGCSKEQYKEVRKTIVEVILHTDMIHHVSMIKNVQLQLEVHSDIVEETLQDKTRVRENLARPMVSIAKKDDEGRMLILTLFMHSADISNPLKPFPICRAWAWRCLEEFFAQGDREKELRIPVQMFNDRDKLNKPQSQIGFIEFVVSPLIGLKLRMMPALRVLGEQLVKNQMEWMNMYIQESKPADKEKQDLIARVTKWQDNFLPQIGSSKDRLSAICH